MSGKKLLSKNRHKTRPHRRGKTPRNAHRVLAPTDPLLASHVTPPSVQATVVPAPAPKPAVEVVPPEPIKRPVMEHRKFEPPTPEPSDDEDDLDLKVVVKESPEPVAESEDVPQTAVDPPGTCGAMFSAKGRRYYQEDRGVVDDATGFYAVFDGHGGDKASRFCAKHMAEYVGAEMAKVGGAATASDEAVAGAFVAAFIALDKKFQDKLVDDGSTACVAQVVRTAAGLRLHVANAGDSRCIVVCADGTAVAMSVDQKPHDPVERARIEAANHEVELIDELVDGKRIKLSRVDGILAVARAIGDHSLKDYGVPPEKTAVTCVPVVQHLAVDPAVHRFVVLASDGVWDVFSNNDAAQLVRSRLPDGAAPTAAALEQAAQALVQGAIDRNSADNCTAVVVAL